MQMTFADYIIPSRSIQSISIQFPPVLRDMNNDAYLNQDIPYYRVQVQ